MADQLPITQRAYTLRLKGTDPQDASWRENLWNTHEAVNKGAKAFGDWLLTMRGGLCHTLADTKDKRIILALSWLSTESEKGAPSNYFVQNDLDTKTGGRSNWKTEDALREILKARKVPDTDIKQWVDDCSASLSAAIRIDAVWVNRSKAFDEALKQIDGSLSREDIWDFIGRFFNDKSIEKAKAVYLASVNDEKTGPEESESSSVADEKTSDLVQKAGQWLSSRFGLGKGANFTGMFEVYKQIAEWSATATTDRTGNETIMSLATALDDFNPAYKDLKGVLLLISGPGHKSATRNLLNKISGSTVVTQEDLDKLKEAADKDSDKCRKKVGNKGKRAYSDRILREVESACGFTYLQQAGPARHSEFAIMLDHAARRVSMAHSWIKRAEAQRRRFEEDASKKSLVHAEVKSWLDRLCESRSLETGSIEPYRIRKRAVDGWEEVVKEWSKTDCRTEADRIVAARSLQDDPELDKFGDIQLFEALAADEAKCIWQQNGTPDAQVLLAYVAATDAEAKKRRFKVPAYRHPDLLLHPVFCDFGNSRWDISFAMHEAAKKGKKPDDKHALSMKLWTGSEVKDVSLSWQSKLLDKDLPFPSDGDSKTVMVPRSSRLSRAAADAPKEAAINIAGLFEQKDWNGRLQAPRQQLKELSEYVAKHGWTDRTRSMRDRIRWIITFSAKLQPMGPWVEFAQNSNLKPNPKYWPHSEENKKRNGMSRLILCRLPGLRLLSVDLGHRYAAACAVWEAISSEEMRAVCKKVSLEPPKANDLYLHLKSPNDKKTTIYRRIGADTVQEIDKNTGESRDVLHPASWARLDRQFLIKLQGEEDDARKASPAERDAVLRLEKELGRVGIEDLSWKVDELMSETVRTVRLALRRHGDRARIAYKMLLDGREKSLTEGDCVGLLTDTLVAWHGLFMAKNWTDGHAKVKWDEYINPLLNGVSLPQTEEDVVATSKERKKHRGEISEKLKPVAEKLAQNKPLRMKLHAAWDTEWRKDDEVLKKNLRWLRDWVLPRGKSAKDKSIRNVGGLSLTRIATIKSLYQVQKAFFTRLMPEGRQMEDGKPVTAGEGFGQSILDTLEHLRENRVKQLASRIAEAALGIGIEHEKINKKDPRRPRGRIASPRFAPCHAVVVENLTHYRPEETRTRRENRQLMDWSAAKVKKYLSEASELNGLHLREIPAGYTSRQDSRTGAPGMRCSDIPVAEFVRQGGYLSKRIKNAKENAGKSKGSAEDWFLCEFYARWDDKNKSWRDTDGTIWILGKDGKWIGSGKALNSQQNCAPKSVRIPQHGGEIFVSADENSPASKGLQADLNAAANIGLKALLDPDWSGRWWYVPCDAKEFKPVADKVKGSAVFQNITSLKKKDRHGVAESTSKKKSTKKNKSKEVVNLWRDLSAAFDGEWRSTSEYWNQVQSRVIKNLCEQAKLDSDDIPF